MNNTELNDAFLRYECALLCVASTNCGTKPELVKVFREDLKLARTALLKLLGGHRHDFSLVDPTTDLPNSYTTDPMT